MPTDDERREAARRLREVQSDVIPGTKTEVHPIAGRIIGVACGYDLPDFQGLLGHLADLIEPSCDRDALLELADEFEDTANELLELVGEAGDDIRPYISNSAEGALSYARRIREACGEVGR